MALIDAAIRVLLNVGFFPFLGQLSPVRKIDTGIMNKIQIMNISSQYFDSIGQQVIITVHKQHILAGCQTESRVSGARLASIFFMQDFDSFVSFPVIVADLAAGIRRAVVNKNDLQIPVGLAKQAVYAFRQIFFNLVDRDNDTDFYFLTPL